MEGATNLIQSCLANVSIVFNQAVSMITGNEVAMLFVGMSVIGSGIGLFRQVTARRR